MCAANKHLLSWHCRVPLVHPLWEVRVLQHYVYNCCSTYPTDPHAGDKYHQESQLHTQGGSLCASLCCQPTSQVLLSHSIWWRGLFVRHKHKPGRVARRVTSGGVKPRLTSVCYLFSIFGILLHHIFSILNFMPF